MTTVNALSTATLTSVPAKRIIADIILEIGIAAMHANEDKMEMFYNTVQQNNRQMANYNSAMAEANKYTQSGGDFTCAPFTYTDPVSGRVSSCTSLRWFMEKNGIPFPSPGGSDGCQLTKEQWNIVVTNLKGASDTLGSTNQIDMMKLQSVINKQNEMSQMVSNNMSKLNQISMSITGNMR